MYPDLLTLGKKFTLENNNNINLPVMRNPSHLMREFTRGLSKSLEQLAVWHPDKSINVTINFNIKDSFNTKHIQDSFNTTTVNNDIDITKDSYNSDSRSWKYSNHQVLNSYNKDYSRRELTIDSNNEYRREQKYLHNQNFENSFNTDKREFSYLNKQNFNNSFNYDSKKILTAFTDLSRKANFNLENSSVGQLNNLDTKDILLKYAKKII